MIAPPIPENESARLSALYRYSILYTPTEKEFDDLAKLASLVCDAPIALVTFVAQDNQWIKSMIGVTPDQIPIVVPRNLTLCAYTILSTKPFIVSDLHADGRFKENPVLSAEGGSLRFYAGVPLLTPNNEAIGTLNVMDRIPRDLSEAQIQGLSALGQQVIMQLEMQRRLMVRSENDPESEFGSGTALLRQVTRSANCVLWSANVKVPGNDWNGVLWQTKFVDEEAAQRFLPVAFGEYLTYQDAYYHAIPNEDRIRSEALVRREVSAERNYSQEYRLCLEDGSLRWIKEDVNVERIDKHHFRLSAVCTDITAQKRTTEERENALATIRQVTTSARCLLWTAEVKAHGIEEKDVNWQVTIVDEEAAQSFLPVDLSKGETYHKAYYLSIIEEDRLRASAYARVEVWAGRNYSLEYRIELADKTIRWIKEDIHVQRVDDHYFRLSAVCTDITYQKKIVEQRESALSALRQVTTSARCLLWSALVRIVPDQSRQYWDVTILDEVAARRFWPVPHDGIEDYARAFTLSILPEDKERCYSFADQEVRAGRSYSQEYRCRMQDGEIRWLHEDVQVAIIDAHQRQLTAVSTDITSQKKIIEQRESALSTLRRVTTSARCLLWTATVIISPDNNHLQWGFTISDEEAARRFWPVYHGGIEDYARAFTLSILPEDKERCSRFANEAIRAGRSYSQEYRCRMEDDQIRWLHEDVQVTVVDTYQRRLTAVSVDITERKQNEERLRLLNSVVVHSYDSVMITEAGPMHPPGPRIIYVNDAFIRMTGYTAEEVIGKTPRIFQGTETDTDALNTIRHSIAHCTKSTVELINYRKDGTPFWNELSLMPVLNQDNICTHWVAVQRDMTARKHEEQRSVFLMRHDPLTGLPNRAWFQEKVQAEILSARKNGYGIAILFIDLDGFKHVNDTLGHDVGDNLLQSVAGRLGAMVGEYDTIARLGGDEFTILMTRLSLVRNSDTPTVFDAPVAMAEKLLHSLQEPILLKEYELLLTASIGISTFHGDAQDTQTLLRQADIAMYKVKEDGKNGYQVYTPTMSNATFERLMLESNLRSAEKNNELILYYQPRVSLQSGEIEGVEALLRWNHSKIGLITPVNFIPLAEETGLIQPIGEWVLLEACKQAAEWQRLGIPLRVSVNISAQQLGRAGIVERIAGFVAETGLDPRYLDLELTETALIRSNRVALTVLEQFKRIGLRLLVDDFGTGYSSLSYLRRFPLDGVKIDASFVAELTDDPQTQAITKAIIDLSHALSLQVIAEGVETEVQKSILIGLGCDSMQGFLFSAAQPAERITEMLAGGKILL